MNYHRIQFEMKKDYGFQLGIVFILIRLTKRIYISQMMTEKKLIMKQSSIFITENYFPFKFSRVLKI